MTKTMAEVLAEHLPIYKFSHTLGESAWACSTPRCEVEGEFSAVIDHQAAALSAAGFGPVREARAEAWDECEAATYEIRLDPTRKFWEPYKVNPYREDT